MARENTNCVVLSGNLTRDPELRATPSGTSVTTLRIACNTRRKDASGAWVDKPNYFDVTVWGKPAENIVQYLGKGSPVMVDGRLEWREWQDKEGNKRQAVEIVAQSVEWLPDSQDRGGSNSPATSAETAGRYGAPAAQGQSALSQPAGQGAGGYGAPASPANDDDDIPF